MLGDVIIVLSQGSFLGGLAAFAILWCVWFEQNNFTSHNIQIQVKGFLVRVDEK